MAQIFSTTSLGAAPASRSLRVPLPCQVPSLTERATLLGIPLELRLHIYDYMSLWPSAEERDRWSGVYFSCRMIQYEMNSHVSFKKDIARNMDWLRAQKTRDPSAFGPRISNQQYPFNIDVVLSPSAPSLLQGLIITLPFRLMDEFPRQFLQSVYALYLDHVTINLVAELEGETAIRRGLPLLPYGDLKSLAPAAFESHVIGGKVNCKKITISIPHLANLTCGHTQKKSTDLNMEMKHGSRCIPYTLTIVQNSMEKQVEKSFFSATRFRPV